MQTSIESTLKQYWGYSSFHPHQKEVIEGLLRGSDVLLLMATGGGKSLCYQLPAVHAGGLTVVISPLIALMKDQVDDLVQRGIPAATINSSNDIKTNKKIEGIARSGVTRLLYVSPEKFTSRSFLSFLHQVPLSMIAIDEAHCISMWGHDFRPEYRELAIIKEEFPAIPVFAMTATATKVVREDIIAQLGMKNPQVHIGSFNRDNLYYEIRPKGGRFADLISYLSQHRGQSGIIYCMTKKETDNLAMKLRNEGFCAISYHAGLDAIVRQYRQEQFVRNEADIVCATIAFGMGIDKPDIRFVIHYDLPKSIEAYYQETGRAGRDGLASDCILYYHPTAYYDMLGLIKSNDLPPEQFAIEERKLKDLIGFCELSSCRRQFLLNYFNEDFGEENCEGCDVCLRSQTGGDDREEVQKILGVVRELDDRLSRRLFKYVITGYRGKIALREQLDLLPCFGICQAYNHKQYDRWIDELIEQGCIGKNSENRNHLFLTGKGRKVLDGSVEVTLSPVPTIYQRGDNRPTTVTSDTSETKRGPSPLYPTAPAQAIPVETSRFSISSPQDEAIRSPPPILKENEEREVVKLDSSDNQPDSYKDYGVISASSALDVPVPFPEEVTDLLYAKLIRTRKEVASREKIPRVEIMNEPKLREIAQAIPTTKEEFLQLRNMTTADWNRYLKDFLDDVIQFFDEEMTQGGEPKQFEVIQEISQSNSLEIIPEPLIFDRDFVYYESDEQLYTELLNLRAKISERRGVNPNNVIYEKNLKELCINYPCSEKNLAALWPWADITIIRDKDEFLSYISTYCEKNNIIPPPPECYIRLPRIEKTPGPSAYETLRLYREGKSTQEISKIRKISPNTVSRHLESILRFDNSIDISEFVGTVHMEKIAAAFAVVGDEYLKPVRDHLGSDYSYDEIAMVRGYLTRCRETQ